MATMSDFIKMQKQMAMVIEHISLKEFLGLFEPQQMIQNLELGDTTHPASGFVDESILQGKNTVADVLNFAYDFGGLVHFSGTIDEYKIGFEKDIFSIEAVDWKIRDLENKLNAFRLGNESLFQKVLGAFPAEIKMPAILKELLEWEDEQQFEKYMSGYYEWNILGREFAVPAWISDPKAQLRFAPIGQSPNGDLFFIWQQDDGQFPIIYLGEGQMAKHFAKNIEDFILLLAIGYEDLAFDYDVPPEKGSQADEKFKTWVKQKINKEIPITGMEIVAAARAAGDDLYTWFKNNNCEGWD
jgi:hypothetical protein